MDKPALSLKAMPDGFGFIYGELVVGDVVFRVDIMPPRCQWNGDFEIPNYQPHATDWVVYVDGNELARVRKREDLETEIVKKLTAT